MSGRGNKPGGFPMGNKLMSRIAAKLGPQGAKRPMQGSSTGPPAKKPNATSAAQNLFKRSLGDDVIPNKDVKPLFPISNDPFTDVTIFVGTIARIESSLASAEECEDKDDKIKSLLLGALKVFLVEKETAFLVEVCRKMTDYKELVANDDVVQALFDCLPFIEPRDKLPAVANTISTLIAAMDRHSSLLLKLVLNDSCCKRLWVDHAESPQVYYSLMSVFGKFVIPAPELYQQADLLWAKKAPIEEPLLSHKFEVEAEDFKCVVEDAVAELHKRAIEEATKNVLRTMPYMIGQPLIREATLKKLDTWLTNMKLQRPGQDLLLFLISNDSFDSTSKETKDMVSDLLSMQSFRSKQHLVVLMAAVELLIQKSPTLLEVIMDTLVDLELSPKAKQLSHLHSIVNHLFTVNLYDASRALAVRVVQDLHRSRLVRTLRACVREFTKTAFRNDFPFGTFARFTFEAVKHRVLFGDEGSWGDLFKNVTGLAASLPLAAVVANVKDGANLRRSGGSLSNTQSEAVIRYQNQMKLFFGSSMEFVKWAVSANLGSTPVYVEAYHLLLYLAYFKQYNLHNDNWPPEIEFNTAIRSIHECAIDETTISSIVNAAKDFPTEQVIVILEALTNRLSAIRPLSSENSLLNLSSVSVLDDLFTLTEAPNISSSEDHLIAYRALYLRVWSLCLRWSLMNTDSLLKGAYERYPLLRMLLHMITIGCAEFPIETLNGKSGDEIRRENELEERVEEEVLNRLSNETEPLRKYCLLKPDGPPRNFPDLVAQLFRFCNENGVTAILCGVRDPDIVSRLVDDDLVQHAMPTVEETIKQSPACIGQLPINTLVYLFLFGLNEATNLQEQLPSIQEKLTELLKADASNSKKVVEFLMAKLCSSFKDDRVLALKAIQMLLGDESTQAAPINALARLPVFNELSDQICRDLAITVPTESDLKLVLDYINFITKHMKSGDIHIVARHLVDVVGRVDRNNPFHCEVRRALFDFCASYLKSLAEGRLNPIQSEIETDFGEIYDVTVPQFPNPFQISSVVLIGILTLLCDGAAENESNVDENQEFLLKVLFSSDKALKVVNAKDQSEVDLFNDKMVRRMFGSFDKRIVKAALDVMTPKMALEYLQSFSITPYAYSQLLAVVNRSLPSVEDARKAVSFVRAYNRRGVEGAQAFLDYVSENGGEESNQTNAEAMDVDPDSLDTKPVIVDEPPKMEFASMSVLESTATYDPLTPTQAVALLPVLAKEPISKIQTMSSWKQLRESLTDEQVGNAVIKELDGESGATQIAQLLVLLLINHAKEISSYRQSLLQLKKHETISRFVQCAFPVAKPLGANAYRNLDASEIFKKLSTAGLSDSEVSRLLFRLREIRPLVFEPMANMEEFERDIIMIFAHDSHPIRMIIEDLAVNGCRTIAARVFDFLLQSHEPRILPRLVMFFVDRCLQTDGKNQQIVATGAQCHVLVEYLMAHMVVDAPHDSPVMAQFMVILEAVLATHGIDTFQSVLQCIGRKMEICLHPPVDEPLFFLLERLVENLGDRFSGCQNVIERFQKDSARFLVRMTEPKTVFVFHREAYFAILEVFNATKAGEEVRIAASQEELKKMTANYPQMIVAHLPLFTNRVLPILTMSNREHREPTYIRFLELVLETVIECDPYSYRCADSINLLLKGYADFFHERATYSQRFQSLFELFTKCCLGYALTNTAAAVAFLEKEVEFFRNMTAFYKFQSLFALIRQIDAPPVVM